MNWKTNIKNKMLNVHNNSQDFMRFLMQRTKSDSVLRVASSLSYTSLIALVPLIAIALAIFSAFPVFNSIRQELLENLVSTLAPDMGNEINNYFNTFVSATAKLTTFGVIGIAVTAVMLLSTIENSLNFIFKVNRSRRFATKITLYWTVITLGPLLLGAAFSLRGYLFTIQKFMSDNINSLSAMFNLLPNAITLFVLMFIYILVPNKKVNFSSAFWGALVSVVLFSLLRHGFGMFVLNNATYKTLYGAMAILPVFLVWMYLSWAVVIFGAVVTAALDDYRSIEGKPLKSHKKYFFKKSS